jgi:hypothetical protein
MRALTERLIRHIPDDWDETLAGEESRSLFVDQRLGVVRGEAGLE